MTRKPRALAKVLGRTDRLLEMWYRPAELAEELAVSKDTIYRSWIPAGAPHRRDDQGHLWICGTDLAAWLESLADRPRVALGPGEAYCMSCRVAVRIAEATWEPRGSAVLVRGRCARCGAAVARFEAAGC